MNTRTPCRAKDPQKCPHHGAAATVESLRSKVTSGGELSQEEVKIYMEASGSMVASSRKKESILAALLLATPPNPHLEKIAFSETDPATAKESGESLIASIAESSQKKQQVLSSLLPHSGVRSVQAANSEAVALNVSKKIAEIDNPEDMEYIARHCLNRLGKGNVEFDKRVGLALYENPNTHSSTRHEVVWALGPQPLAHMAKKLKDPVLLDCLNDDLYSDDTNEDGEDVSSRHTSVYLVSKTLLDNRKTAEGTRNRIYRALPGLKVFPAAD